MKISPDIPTDHGTLLFVLTCVQALCDGGGIDEEATAESTSDVWVELIEGELGL